MAFSEGSAQALTVLNQILGRAEVGRQADKDRALKIVQMKIATDEAEANRLNTYLNSLSAQNLVLEQEYVKATGLQSKMDSLGQEDGYAGDGSGSAIAAKKTGVLAMDRAGLKERITEAEAERQDILNRMSSYFEAYNRLAPEQFERYVQAGADKTLSGMSTIGDDEFGMITEDLKAQGIDLTPEREAGLRKALNALGEQRFDQEYKERLLNLRSAELRASLKAGKAGTGARDFMAQMREKIHRTNTTAKAMGLKDNIDLQIPLTSQSTAGEMGVSAARSLANYLITGGRIDRSGPLFGLFKDTPDYMIDLLDDYKKASGEQRNRIAMQVAEEFVKNPDLVEAFDYEGLGKGSERAHGGPAFVGDLVDIYASAMWFDYGQPVNAPAGIEALTYKGIEPGVDAATEPESKGFFDSLIETLNAKFNTPPPDAEKGPGLLDFLRRDKPFFTIGGPDREGK
jgi:hypothetical protein